MDDLETDEGLKAKVEQSRLDYLWLVEILWMARISPPRPRNFTMVLPSEYII